MSVPVLSTPQPPVTGRTNLATVTYPVILATDAQRVVTENKDEMLWDVHSPKPTIDQFSILLTRKNLPLRQGSKHLPVFSRLNKIKAPKYTDRKKMRIALQNQLKFAGIAFTGVEEGYGDGAPRMIASVIGGSHTVMSYNNQHTQTPLRPGSMVRWTLPKVNDDAPGNSTGPVVHPPVVYHGASGSGVFAELEEVTPESTLAAIYDNLDDMSPEEKIKWKNFQTNVDNCPCESPGKCRCTHFTWVINYLLKQIQAVNEREIGVVIQDNGKGSIDIRLK